VPDRRRGAVRSVGAGAGVDSDEEVAVSKLAEIRARHESIIADVKRCMPSMTGPVDSERAYLLDLVTRMRDALEDAVIPHSESCDALEDHECTCGLDALLEETK
jgi:autonomous glycyl radical cofactor GrcA